MLIKHDHDSEFPWESLAGDFYKLCFTWGLWLQGSHYNSGTSVKKRHAWAIRDDHVSHVWVKIAAFGVYGAVPVASLEIVKISEYLDSVETFGFLEFKCEVVEMTFLSF